MHYREAGGAVQCSAVQCRAVHCTALRSRLASYSSGHGNSAVRGSLAPSYLLGTFLMVAQNSCENLENPRNIPGTVENPVGRRFLQGWRGEGGTMKQKTEM